MSEGNEEFNVAANESFIKFLTKKAKYSERESETMIEEYKIFKNRLCELHICDKTNNEIIRLYKYQQNFHTSISHISS